MVADPRGRPAPPATTWHDSGTRSWRPTTGRRSPRYGNGLRRLGAGPAATRFFDEHVAAEAVHEQIAAVDLCGSFVASEPDQAGEVLFGAGCALALDGAAAGHLLDSRAD
jgi:hypothetical protein